MSLLEFSQIFFNFTASVVFVLILVSGSFILAGIIRTTRNINSFIKNLEQRMEKVSEHFTNFFSTASKMNFLGNFFRNKKSKTNKTK